MNGGPEKQSSTAAGLAAAADNLLSKEYDVQ
jgi:hypothetical protein